MNEKTGKELQPHEEVLKQFDTKNNMIDIYLTSLSIRLEHIMASTKKEIINNRGINYLETEQGHKEYGELGAKIAQEEILKEFNLNKDKFNEKELGSLVNIMYDSTQKTFTDFARKHGSKLNYGLISEDFEGQHLTELKASAIKNYILQPHNSNHNIAILDHIFAEKTTEYFKPNLIDEINKERMNPKIFEAYINFKKSGAELNTDYLINDQFWHPFIKSEILQTNNKNYNPNLKN